MLQRLSREGRIGDDIVEGLEGVAVPELGIGQRVALHDQRGGVVVQDHVHAGEAAGGGVLFLAVERDGGAGLVADLQEQRAGAAGRVVDGGGGAGLGVTDADDLRDDAADFGGRVELALALATLGGEVPHQVFVGVAENVVALGAVLREIEGLFSKMAMRLVSRSTFSLPLPSFSASLKSGMSDSLLALASGAMIFLLIWSPMSVLPLSATMSLKLAPLGMVIGGVGLTGVLVADVLDEEQDEDVVLVLAGIHAAA